MWLQGDFLMKKLRSILYRLRGEVSTEDLIKIGLKVGKNFRRNEHCIIDQSHCWLITIGDDVTLAPNVHILAHDASMWADTGYTRISPVNIGNNVFIGAGSIILPGVTIGNNVVIGAGSVVTKNIEDNKVVTGNPAKIISSYDEFINKNKELIKSSPCYDETYTLRNKNFSAKQKQQMKNEIKENSVGFVE